MNDLPKNILGEVPESFHRSVVGALDALTEKPARRSGRRWIGYAAVAAAVAVLGGTALATDLFGLRSAQVADAYASETADIYGITGTSDVIALQGASDSPEYRAVAEWEEFLAGYDTDGTILASEEAQHFSSGTGADFYGAYSPEMAEELCRITEKYGLSLHTSLDIFSDMEELCAITGLNAFLPADAVLCGYVYEDGTFHGDGQCMAGDTLFSFQLGRYVKGSFTDTTLNLGDLDSYEEWDITAPDGTAVHLALGAMRSVIMADLPAAFVSVNILGGTAGDEVFMPEGIDASALEASARLIDYTALG